MKKILVCLILAIIASNCEISINRVKAQDERKENVVTEISPLQRHRRIEMSRVTVDGMELMVFFTSTGYTSPHVVNLTKEKLEIDLLTKQLNN